MKKNNTLYIGLLALLLLIPLSITISRHYGLLSPTTYRFRESTTINSFEKFAEDCESKEEDIVKTFCWMTQAKIQKDASICEKISTTDINYTMCLANVGEITKDVSVCDKTVEKDRCYFILGEALRDESICKLITNEDTRQDCLTRVTKD